MQGPLGFTDLDAEGMLTEGFNETGTFTTLYNFPYYPEILSRLGFTADAEWYEYQLIIPEKGNDKIARFSELSKKRNALRRVNLQSKKQLYDVAPNVFRLINTCFSDLYCTVELTDKQIEYFTKQYFGFIGLEYLGLIENRDHEIIAFALAVPSISETLQRSKGRLFPFGFIKLLRTMRKPKRLELLLLAVDPAP